MAGEVIHFGIRYSEPTLCGNATCGKGSSHRGAAWATEWSWHDGSPEFRVTCPDCLALRPPASPPHTGGAPSGEWLAGWRACQEAAASLCDGMLDRECRGCIDLMDASERIRALQPAPPAPSSETEGKETP